MKQIFEFLKSPQNIIKHSPIKAPKVKANVSGTLALIGYFVFFIVVINWVTNTWPIWEFAEQPAQYKARDKAKAIETVLQKMHKDLGIHSEVFYAKVLGEEGLEVYLEKSFGNKPSEVYQIASISKALTGLSFLGLQEEGYLSLEDPACKYIESFCKLSLEQVRIIDLLRHRSGLAVIPLSPLKFIRFISSTLAPWELEELYKTIPSSLSVSPDKKFQDNNSNYIVLSMILAALEIDEDSSALNRKPKESKELTSEKYQQNFYKALEISGLNIHQDSMKSSTTIDNPFPLLNESRIPGYSSIIIFNKIFRLPVRYLAMDLNKSYGAGGLVTSVKDLFYGFKDVLIKKPQYLSLIEKNLKDEYSLGFVVSELSDGRYLLWHNGQSPGYRSLMTIDHKNGEIFVWLANSWVDQEQQATLAKSLRLILSEKPYPFPKE